MPEILIIGAGLAGAAAATLLAQAGRQVLLLEREPAAAHKICGEFLSGEALSTLATLGLRPHGAPITHVRLVRGTRIVTAPLPFPGIGLTRKSLDETLLRHAQAAGAQIRRPCPVRGISGNLEVHLAGGEILHPRHLLLATGKHDLRGLPRAAPPGDFVGFKTYFRLSPSQSAALSRHVELILLPGGYAGLQLVEDGAANLTLLVRAQTLHQAGRTWPALLAQLQRRCPHLATRLHAAEPLLPAPLAIARIPYGFLHRPAPSDPAQLFRLGDQAAVIESFTGDGMSIALHSAHLAARTLLAGGTGPAYHRALAAGISTQLRRAAWLRHCLTAPLLGPAFFAAAQALPAALAIAAAATRLPPSIRLAD